MIPLAQRSKRDLIYLATHRCQHRHLLIEHPQCEASTPRRLGHLDIETSNLDADYGFIITWAIKVDGEDEVYTDVLTKKDLDDCKPGEEDKRLVQSLINKMMEFDEVTTYYGCLTPGHRVLTADLRWVPVETLVAGDQIAGFDEEAEGGKGNWRHWKTATVIHNIPVERDVFEIELANGKTLTATGDHPWLVQRNNKWCWRPTTELIHQNGTNQLQRILPVWEPDTSYAAGYAAAFIDGEGGIYQAPKGRGYNDHTFTIQASQKDTKIIQRMQDAVTVLGHTLGICLYDPNNRNISGLTIQGCKGDKMAFLGQVRPEKLRNFSFDKLGRVDFYGEDTIVAIRSLGKRMVCGLGTSTSTYVAEGYGCHNTKFDIPYIRTRALVNGLTFPEFGTLHHIDCYYAAKFKLKLSRNGLDQVCRTILGKTEKTRVAGEIWRMAARGDKKAIGYILDHNVKDVRDLERVYHKLLPFMRHTRRSV